MFNPIVISLEVGAKPQFTEGLTGTGRDELRAAQRVLKDIGNSRFSAKAFGEYLYEASATTEEMDKTMLAALYFINSVAGGDDSSQSFMARRIIDALDHYGYVNVGIEG